MINSSRVAKLEAEKADAREQIELVLADAYAEKKLNSKYDENEFLDKFIKDRLKNVIIEEKRIGLNGFLFELDRSVPRLGKYIGQATGPIINEINVTDKTTNSISIEVNTSNADDADYTYLYKKNEETEWIEAGKGKENTFKFDNLEADKIYNIKVIVETKSGRTEQETNERTGEMPTGKITFGDVTWQDGLATVTIHTEETGYTLQYQIDNALEEGWQTIENGGAVSNLQLNQTVYARLFDGKNGTEPASESIKDGVSPTVSITSAKAIYDTIEVIVEANDEQSGLATSNTYKFYFDDYLMSTTEEPYYKITGLPSETQYTIKVEAYDKAGNMGEDSTTATTEKAPSEIEIAKDNGTQYNSTTSLEDDSGDEVWIPGGFKIADDSATDADDGIVIQDSKGNQFVWIPVPDYTTMYATGTYTLCGVTTTTSVYSKLRVRGEDSYTVTTPGSTSQIREPDLVTSYDTNSSYYSILASSAKGMADDMVAEYTATYNSIKKYKGFYIGRYELAGTVSSPTVKKGQTVLTDQNWYNLKKACTNVVSSSYAQSTMVYGNQWDEIMSWLVSSGGKTSSQVNTDSSSWGNYSNSTGAAATNSGSKQTSGKNEAWKANNIYDLAGNCRELTQEADGTRGRIFRGRLFRQFRFLLSSISPWQQQSEQFQQRPFQPPSFVYKVGLNADKRGQGNIKSKRNMI